MPFNYVFKCSMSFLTFLYWDVVSHVDVADTVAFNAVAIDVVDVFVYFCNTVACLFVVGFHFGFALISLGTLLVPFYGS